MNSHQRQPWEPIKQLARPEGIQPEAFVSKARLVPTNQPCQCNQAETVRLSQYITPQEISSFPSKCTRFSDSHKLHLQVHLYQEAKQMAATLKLRILAVAAAAAVVASSLVGTAVAAEGPAPAPTSDASMAAPAVAAASLTALVFGYLF
ncbi:hypothetical protein ACP70R_035630 [Stipagrostis hirtigluma subsp. patula]